MPKTTRAPVERRTMTTEQAQRVRTICMAFEAASETIGEADYETRLIAVMALVRSTIAGAPDRVEAGANMIRGLMRILDTLPPPTPNGAPN